MGLGETLRNARMARGLTCEQVAHATHMKVQTVQALEAEDFSRVAAHLYAKGFIKLYASHLGLDPAPLIAEYETRFAAGDRPSLRVAGTAVRPRSAAGEPPKRTTEAAPPSASTASHETVGTERSATEGGDEKRAVERGKRNERGKVGVGSGATPGVPPCPEPVAAAMRVASRRRPGGAAASWRVRAAGVWAECCAVAERIMLRLRGLARIRGALRLDPAGRRRIPPLSRMIWLTLGALLLLGLVLSSLSRFFRSPAGRSAEAAPSAGREVRLAADPPDLYMD